MGTRAWAAKNLASKLLAGPWTPQGIAAGVDAVLGARRHWTRKALVSDLVTLGDGTYPPAPRVLAAYLIESAYFRPSRRRAVTVVLDAPISPSSPFTDLRVPALATVGELAEWLGQPPGHVDWLADERRAHARAVDASLQHYRYSLIS